MKLILSALAVAALTLASAAAQAGGPGCSSKSASASAGAGCSYSKTAAMPEGLKVEAVRLPSGALAVLYTSTEAEVVKTLQEKAAAGADGFSCGLCRQMAASNDCKVELIAFSGGVMAFVTSDNPGSIDVFEKQFAALTSAEAATAQ